MRCVPTKQRARTCAGMPEAYHQRQRGTYVTRASPSVSSPTPPHASGSIATAVSARSATESSTPTHLPTEPFTSRVPASNHQPDYNRLVFFFSCSFVYCVYPKNRYTRVPNDRVMWRRWPRHHKLHISLSSCRGRVSMCVCVCVCVCG